MRERSPPSLTALPATPSSIGVSVFPCWTSRTSLIGEAELAMFSHSKRSQDGGAEGWQRLTCRPASSPNLGTSVSRGEQRLQIQREGAIFSLRAGCLLQSKRSCLLPGWERAIFPSPLIPPENTQWGHCWLQFEAGLMTKHCGTSARAKLAQGQLGSGVAPCSPPPSI